MIADAAPPPHALQEPAAAMLRRLAVHAPPRLTPMPGGANNRVYRVDAGDRRWLLKSYYHSHDDPRDRCGAEWSFASFAWSIGAAALPQPLAVDGVNRLCLFEFIAGDPVEPGRLTRRDIADARRFVRRINRARTNPAAGDLSSASEACFTVEQHLTCVDRRLTRLTHTLGPAAGDAEARAAADLVCTNLRPLWDDIRARVLQRCAESNVDPQSPIAPADRVLSPSDFGFHNALRGRDGRLRFIDFEYAGWDDPAKLVCDFFCQPAVPVPMHHMSGFTRLIAGLTTQPDLHRRRIELLMPVYRCKWVCIVLNEFLPAAGERRRFALGDDMTARRAQQLEQARRLVKALRHEATPAAA